MGGGGHTDTAHTCLLQVTAVKVEMGSQILGLLMLLVWHKDRNQAGAGGSSHRGPPDPRGPGWGPCSASPRSHLTGHMRGRTGSPHRDRGNDLHEARGAPEPGPCAHWTCGRCGVHCLGRAGSPPTRLPCSVQGLSRAPSRPHVGAVTGANPSTCGSPTQSSPAAAGCCEALRVDPSASKHREDTERAEPPCSPLMEHGGTSVSVSGPQTRSAAGGPARHGHFATRLPRVHCWGGYYGCRGRPAAGVSGCISR